MNLENFTQVYKSIITESTDEDLKNYIRSIVKDTLAEYVQPKNYNVPEKTTIGVQVGPVTREALGIISGGELQFAPEAMM